MAACTQLSVNDLNWPNSGVGAQVALRPDLNGQVHTQSDLGDTKIGPLVGATW